jgi:hypothetical protein
MLFLSIIQPFATNPNFMKTRTLLLVLLSCFAALLTAQTTDLETIKQSAKTLYCQHHADATIERTMFLESDEGTIVGLMLDFDPPGFIVATTSQNLRPVYAYSFTNNIVSNADQLQLLKKLITQDLNARQTAIGEQAELKQVHYAWESFLSGSMMLSPFQQWPPEGSTPTEGWILTNWKQSAPYNDMCPMDLNAGARSIAGCPATAMAQIVNYHETLNNTTMNDGDDYYHSYAGNQYWIDDDHETYMFPDWDSLNTWLTSLQYVYETQGTVLTEMKAALSFACGVGAHTVYSASMSGTFGIDQAWDSFQRFGFDESQVIYPSETDTVFNQIIAENIKVALPVQLGLQVDPPGNGGHNVVADGYNTDEFYHFNFGWGGGSNGWYTLPPTYIVYNLTIIEGAVVDIKSTNYTGITTNESDKNPIQVYPNPLTDFIRIAGLEKPATATLYDLSGRMQKQWHVAKTCHSEMLQSLKSGIYLLKIQDANQLIYSGKIIKR